MANPTCSSCIHWDKNQDGTPADERADNHRFRNVGARTPHEIVVHRCGRIPMYTHSFVWAWSDDDEEAALLKFTPGPRAFAHDASDYVAYVTTTPDFYCNQWGAK